MINAISSRNSAEKQNISMSCCWLLLYLHYYCKQNASRAIRLWCGVLLYFSNNFRTKHHEISIAWLSNFFSLCLISFVVILQNQLHRMARTSLATNFATSQRNPAWNSQLRNEIAKVVANFGNFKRTSETVCQKFCETHWSPANNKWENKDVKIYVGRFTTMHNVLFCAQSPYIHYAWIM